MRGIMVSGGIAAALTTAACAGAAPTIQYSSPDGIDLYWYHYEAVSIDQARRVATGHCRAYDKSAVLLDEFADHDVTRAKFACR